MARELKGEDLARVARAYGLSAQRYEPTKLQFEPQRLEELCWYEPVFDSRDAGPETSFFALPGRKVDGAKFLVPALQMGSRLLVGEQAPETLAEKVQAAGWTEPFDYVWTRDARRSLAELSALFYGEPAKALTVVGITGTKGKSSVAHLLTGLLEKAGQKPVLIGTTGIYFAGSSRPSPNTTPESCLIQKEMASAVAQGATHLVIELSSQAFAMGRNQALPIELAVFLNLVSDHIGPLEHSDYEDYKQSKFKIFETAERALINLDAKESPAICEAALAQLAGRVYGYSLHCSEGRGDLERLFCWSHLEEREGRIQADYRGQVVELRPAADYVASNALAALAALDLLGLYTEEAVATLGTLTVPGRLETLLGPHGGQVVIDYAHNEMSLEALLAALAPSVQGRLIVLFGSVGERSQERRRELPRVAKRYADLIYLTSDNPASEDPLKICEEMAAALGPDFTAYRIEPDRKKAIEAAVAELGERDLLLLAGKGHERYQLIGDEKVPFCEREIVEAAWLLTGGRSE